MSKIEDLSMKQHVYEYIRDKILTLELEPGERIPESQIAADLGISRTPVREAVRLLSWEGLITIRPNHSATVVVLDDKKVQDLLLVRWQHDALAVPLAIYNGSRREFEELRKTAKECIEANNRGNLWCRHELDSKFHRDIVKTCGYIHACQPRYQTLASPPYYGTIHTGGGAVAASGAGRLPGKPGYRKSPANSTKSLLPVLWHISGEQPSAYLPSGLR